MTRKAYVFMIKRPVDKAEWPVVYTNPELADRAFGRISQVIMVDFDAEVATAKERADLTQTLLNLRETVTRVSPENELRPACGALLDMLEQLVQGKVKL